MAQQEYLSGVLGLGPGHEPLIITPCWNLNEFMGHLVCVIDPDSSWIPRIILAPDYIWLGLHWDGSNCRGEFWFFCPGRVASDEIVYHTDPYRPFGRVLSVPPRNTPTAPTALQSTLDGAAAPA